MVSSSAPGRARRWTGRVLLVGVSTLLALTAAELFLRFGLGRYTAAAEAVVVDDDERIFVRSAGERRRQPHPARDVAFEVGYNDRGLRHDREISDAELASATTVGFFGDSNTENVNMPAAYGFVEVVDHLLNQHDRAFTTLNFGVSGYGTDQAYLSWRAWAREHGSPDVVVYVLSGNDLRNVHENGLFVHRASDDSIVHVNEVRRRSWLTSALAGLHLTYLVLDAHQRFTVPPERRAESLRRRLYVRDLRQARDERVEATRASEWVHRTRVGDVELSTRSNPALAPAADLLIRLVARWRHEVEAAGSRFIVAPYPGRHEQLIVELFAEDTEVVPLFQRFERDWGAGRYRARLLRFDNDGHWREEAQHLAAMEIYEAVAAVVGLRVMEPPAIERALGDYYSAVGSYWHPTRWMAPSTADEATLAAIRARYSALSFSPSR